MTGRILLLGGIALAVTALGLTSFISFAHVGNAHRQVNATAADKDHASGKHDGDHGGEEDQAGESEGVRLSKDQIDAAGIAVAPVSKGRVVQRLVMPGVIAMDQDRIARIPANVVGIVSDLRKKLGDTVEKGEVIAALESREVAEARSEYISALVSFALQKTLYERDRALWQKQITPEQQYLRTRSAYSETRVRTDLARQKLLALGIDARDIDALSKQAASAVEAKEGGASVDAVGKALRRYEIRSPIAGRVVERRVDLGAPVGREGQESELYVIADLSKVWVDITLPAADLDRVREGNTLLIRAASSKETAPGRVIFVSPVIAADTRAARAIALVDNPNLIWRPGTFVTAEIAIDENAVETSVPIAAIQRIEGEHTVFVRTPNGFEKRKVAIARQDGETAEIASGVSPGENVAVSNTFILKAELGKGSAEHAH
ncbi:efflux RND transporter periplasmic adaptor subunit [Rhodomicrobium sp.]|uniref:efflux RND transporter periplasmic adaptor subunit n=1 Tax=Rhodomicrobium sp. TaxID=2720632 RepID=UPI0039E54B6D